jgi:hypothetical protein
MHDDSRLDHDIAVVNQGRNDGIGIELHVVGLELIPAQREQAPVPIDALLGEREPRFDGAYRSLAMIKDEHVILHSSLAEESPSARRVTAAARVRASTSRYIRSDRTL